MKINFKGLIAFVCLSFTFSAILLSGCAGSADTETGKLKYRQQNWQEAESALVKGLMMDKTDEEAWYMLGHSQVKLGKFDDAQKSFKQVMAISNKYADNIKFLWGETYNSGVEKYNNALKSLKTNDTVISKKSFQEALNLFIGTTKIIPDSIKPYSIIGDTYSYLGNPDKAYDAYKFAYDKTKSKEDAQKVATSLYEKGVLVFKTGDFTASADAFNKIMTFENLSKESNVYEASVYYYALSKAATGADVRDKKPESDDYKAYFKEAQRVLEPLLTNLKNKESLEIRVYELLINIYASLGDSQKATDYLKIKTELENKKK